MNGELRRAAGLLAGARWTLAYAGPEMARESGAPPAVGAGGPWEGRPARVYASASGLAGLLALSPARFRAFLREAADAFLLAEPNAGHRALARLSDLGLVRALISETIDDLHDRAGSRDVFKPNGSLFRVRCPLCDKAFNWPREEAARIAERLATSAAGRLEIRDAWRALQPRCTDDGGRMRPDLALFGAARSERDLRQIARRVESADAVLACGVETPAPPAAEALHAAVARGASLIEVGSAETPLSAKAAVRLRGRPSAVLPALVAELGDGRCGV